MKMSCILCISIFCLVIQNVFPAATISTANGKEIIIGWYSSSSDSNIYVEELKNYAKYAEAASGGFAHGNRVLIRVGNHTFYDNIPHSRATTGLYVVAIYKNKVLLQRHYNTFTTPGASEGLARDIDKLPGGTFVIVAAKDEPTKLFDERGQKALYRIGAEKGLLNQKFRTSYLCLGVKGLARGKAIEMVGMEELKYAGSKVDKHISFIFLKKKEPQVFKTPGRHEGLMIGDTEVIYYIPRNFDPKTAEYLFGIHGAGDWHRPGASNRIAQFRDIADIENLVVIAPAFDCILNWLVEWRKDFDEDGKFKDPRVIKDWHLWDFVALLNNHNEHRTDLKLLEIFDFFNRRLMKRKKFHLYGHSGGGQFVVRFITFYPELINKVAASSPGTFAFPYRDRDYPWGLKTDNLEKTFGSQIKADDLKLSDSELDKKMNRLLDLQLFLIAGEKETAENHPHLAWQGKGTLHKTRNYYEAMKQEDQRLKKKGVRSKSKPFKFELHIMPDVGHHSGEGAKKAIELLFPSKRKVKSHLTSERKVSLAPNYQGSDRYLVELHRYAECTEVVSEGYHSGNRVLIKVGGHTYYDNVPDGPDRAGLYVVAIFENEVLLQYHYNTYNSPGSCEWLMTDFRKLPLGTFVVIAAKDEPTNYFNETGQEALYRIGADKGLLNQEFRTSYLCLGVKGLDRGGAIEMVGMEELKYLGSDVDKNIGFTFPKEPQVKGEFFKIYDAGIGRKEMRSVNDHCFIYDHNGKWHMFGILITEPYMPISERVFVHAAADSLTQVLWERRPFALRVDSKSNEVHLWAPHVIFHDGLYYMYYCAGDKDRTKYKIHLAVSKNLNRWERHSENPMVVDGFDARDPFILKVGKDWVMYYTATSSPAGGNHVVACRTSRNLIHWGNCKIVFRDPTKGKSGGPTESPTVVRRGPYYYLFIGPRNEYAGTDIFRSKDPFKWDINDRVGHISSHAAEVIRDVDGKWYTSHCGKGQGGVYLAPLEWNDNLDNAETSIPIPKESR